MSGRLRPAIVGVVVLAAPLLALASVAARQTPRPPATATLSGVVVSTGDAARPIRRAAVTVESDALGTPLSAITGDDGAFRFQNLPPGRYRVSASKAAWVTMAFGASRPGQPGTPIAVETGTAVDDVAIALPPGAVITGTVRDTAGVPVPDLSIAAFPVGSIGAGPARVGTRDHVSTDDRGVYRVYGLVPGDYVVAVMPRNRDASLEITMTTDVDTVFRQLETRRSAAVSAPLVDRTTSIVAFAPLFYPDATSAADAAPIRLVAGQVRDGVDFTLRLVPSGSVVGEVARADGGAIGQVSLSLDAFGPPLPTSLIDWRLETRPTSDAPRYRFARVAPGRYVVSARATVDTPDGGGDHLWAMSEVLVAEGGDAGADLMLQPAVTLSGTVTFDPRPGSPALPEPSTVTVGLQRRDRSLPGETPSPFAALPVPRSTVVDADWTFALGGVVPGVYSPVSAAAGWRLEAVMLGERDLLDLPLAIDEVGSDVAGIEIRFSNRPRRLTGVLQTPAGVAASGFFVMVFPADPEMWRPGARRIHVARPDTNGRYVIDDLPAGDYLLAALTDLDDTALADPAFLGQVAPLALPVAVTDLPQTTQDIAIGG